MILHLPHGQNASTEASTCKVLPLDREGARHVHLEFRERVARATEWSTACAGRCEKEQLAFSFVEDDKYAFATAYGIFSD